MIPALTFFKRISSVLYCLGLLKKESGDWRGVHPVHTMGSQYSFSTYRVDDAIFPSETVFVCTFNTLYNPLLCLVFSTRQRPLLALTVPFCPNRRDFLFSMPIPVLHVSRYSSYTAAVLMMLPLRFLFASAQHGLTTLFAILLTNPILLLARKRRMSVLVGGALIVARLSEIVFVLVCVEYLRCMLAAGQMYSIQPGAP